MCKGGGCHPLRVPELCSCRERAPGCWELYLPFSSFMLLGSWSPFSHLSYFTVWWPVWLFWEYFSTLSGSSSWDKQRETLREKNQLNKNPVLFIFVNTKAPQTFDLDLLLEDACMSARHCWNTRAEQNGPTCWAITQLLIPADRAASDLECAGRTGAASHFGHVWELCSFNFRGAILSGHPSSQRAGQPCQMQTSNEQCLWKRDIMRTCLLGIMKGSGRLLWLCNLPGACQLW